MCISGDMKSVQLELKEVKEKVMDGLYMVDLDVRRVVRWFPDLPGLFCAVLQNYGEI